MTSQHEANQSKKAVSPQVLMCSLCITRVTYWKLSWQVLGGVPQHTGTHGGCDGDRRAIHLLRLKRTRTWQGTEDTVGLFSSDSGFWVFVVLKTWRQETSETETERRKRRAGDHAKRRQKHREAEWQRQLSQTFPSLDVSRLINGIKWDNSIG